SLMRVDRRFLMCLRWTFRYQDRKSTQWPLTLYRRITLPRWGYRSLWGARYGKATLLVGGAPHVLWSSRRGWLVRSGRTKTRSARRCVSLEDKCLKLLASPATSRSEV